MHTITSMTQARISKLLQESAAALDVGTPIVHDEAYWLEWMLENWSRFMRGDERPEGLPSEGCGGAMNYTIETGDTEAACDQMDVALAEATNAAIEGLDVAEQVAIYAAYGVAAVWRYNRETDVLDRAKEHVKESLKRRGCWLGEK